MGELRVMIGRSSQCDYIIENSEQHGTVSGKHATISDTDTPSVYLFEDHSTNGSYVNGQFIHNNSCKINVSDYITLGKTYRLPLAEIEKRYFSSRPTDTKQKLQPQPIVTMPKTIKATEVQPLKKEEDIPVDFVGGSAEPYVATEEKWVKKVPAWFWTVYGVSMFIAFLIGVAVGCM